jgi:transglutaminase-like putative cysteine protease
VTAQEKIRAVLGWLDQNIRKEPVDAFSALDVLDARRAECQGHAYLYAALMRALAVPTRVVNGLVYSAEYGGFLYHTWAESLVDGSWRAVDPTFNQTSADATHIALVRGENLAELTALVDWVGNTRMRVLEAR